jgi:hypothetical protein
MANVIAEFGVRVYPAPHDHAIGGQRFERLNGT